MEANLALRATPPVVRLSLLSIALAFLSSGRAPLLLFTVLLCSGLLLALLLALLLVLLLGLLLGLAAAPLAACAGTLAMAVILLVCPT